MIVDELIAVLGFDVRGEGELRKFDQHIDRAERKARTFTATLGRMAVAAGGAIAAFGASRALSGFVSSITRTNAEFEKMEATLRTIEGSADKARSSLEWIKEFGATTPYEVGELTDAFVRLRAYGLDPMDGSFRSLGDAAAAMGKPFMAAVEAMADAVTGENERLKEFGIRASVAGDQITYSWEQNGKTLTKTVSKNGAEISAALTEIFGRFDGAMDGLSKTWDGMVSNLLDRWTFFLTEIGEAGYYEEIKQRLRGVLDLLERWWKDGTIDRIAEGVSGALVGMIEFGEHAARQIGRLGSSLYSAARRVTELTSQITGLGKEWAGLGLGAAALGSTTFGRAFLLMILRRMPGLAGLLAADDLISALNGDRSVLGSTAEGAASVQRLKDGMAELDAALTRLGSAFEGLRARISSGWADLKARFGEKISIGGVDLGSLDGAFAAVEQWGARTIRRLKLLFTDPLALIMELIQGAIDRVAFGLEALATTVDRITGAIQGIADFFGLSSGSHANVTVDPIHVPLPEGEDAAGEVRRNTESTGSRLDAIKDKLGDLLNFLSLTTEAAAAVNPGVAAYGGSSGSGGSGAGSAGRAAPGSPAHGAAGARSMGASYGSGDYRGDLASAIVAAANELGIDPEDLGTAISYETAGTFDPWKKGPKTKWGRHRGLIQWGGPQRRKYGVTKDMTAGEQMQAVARYLRDRGVKPGHGLLEIYSAINAGAVGEQYYGRSDAHAGGAPGTVRDKVNNQMGGHRRKARALLASLAGQGDAPAANDNMAAALKAAGDGVWWLGQNGRTIGGQMDRMGASGAASRAQGSVNSNSTAYHVAQTINVGGVNVNGTDKAPEAVGRAVGDAAAAGGRKTPVLARRQVNPGAAP